MAKILSTLGIAAAVSLLPSLVQAHSFQIDTMINAEGGGRNDVSIGRDSIGLAYDSMGNLGMCYFDGNNDDLKFAIHEGNAWVIETAHADRDGDVVGKDCAIIFDDDDNPNVVYYNDTDSVLMHAVKANGRWQQSIVDVRVRSDFFGTSRVSIAKDGRGDIAVAYYNRTNQDLKYAKLEGGRWTVMTLQNVGDVGRHASLAFDRNNNPAIAYQDYTDQTHSALKYIAFDRNANAWRQPETVDGLQASGYFPSLKFDSNSKPHIAYRFYNAAERSYLVYYINKVGDRWSERYDLTHQQGQATGQYLQMAVDDANNVYIVYMDQFLSALFPDVNYLLLTTLYFADHGMDVMSSRTDRLAFSVIPMIDYAGLAIAVDSNYNLMVAWAQESGRNYDLVTARLTAWSPSVALLTPNANSNTGLNTFELQWLDFDPDSNARIRFTRRDGNWNTVTFNETALENEENTGSINLSDVPRGEYTIGIEISDDDFNMTTGDWGPSNLTVQNHTPSAPVLASPAHNGAVDSATPTLQWAAASDPDNDAVTYTVQVATDDGFANIAASGNADNASWASGVNLTDGTTYYWRVRARDAEGGLSNWSPARSFGIALPVVAAQAPAAQAPANPAAQVPDNPGQGRGQQNAPNHPGNHGQAPDPHAIGGGGNAPVDPGQAGRAQMAGGNAGGASSGSSGGGSASSAAPSPAAGGCSLMR